MGNYHGTPRPTFRESFRGSFKIAANKVVEECRLQSEQFSSLSGHDTAGPPRGVTGGMRNVVLNAIVKLNEPLKISKELVDKLRGESEKLSKMLQFAIDEYNRCRDEPGYVPLAVIPSQSVHHGKPAQGRRCYACPVCEATTDSTASTLRIFHLESNLMAHIEHEHTNPVDKR